MYLYDYHMHTRHSTDARNTIHEMCVKSIALGLKEIAITDHFEPTFGNEEYESYKPDKYFLEIQEAKLCFGKEIKIKSGIELGQPHTYPEYLQKLIEMYSYDYVLSSVHKMKDDIEFGEIQYNDQNASHYCLKYLDELKALTIWNKFDCIGHLDLVKRYASKYNTKAAFLDYKERLEEVLKIIIFNGKGIEVNTSGLRQDAKECLPNLDIISFYRQLGGEIITVGSDAHCADDVGKGIKEAIEIIKLAGFNYTSVYTKRQPFMIKIANKSSVYDFSKQSA